jgi:hypothetical protein
VDWNLILFSFFFFPPITRNAIGWPIFDLWPLNKQVRKVNETSAKRQIRSYRVITLYVLLSVIVAVIAVMIQLRGRGSLLLLYDCAIVSRRTYDRRYHHPAVRDENVHTSEQYTSFNRRTTYCDNSHSAYNRAFISFYICSKEFHHEAVKTYRPTL